VVSFDATAGWLAADDQENAPFFPYNYQAGTQLGYPILDERAELGSLLHYPLSAQVPQEDLPPGVPVRPLNQHLMREIHQWVRLHGSHLIFLYGQDDPWSDQRFVLGPGSRDSVIYTVKGGSHVSPYTELPPDQAQAFVNKLKTWAGLSTSKKSATRTGSASAPPIRP
jgi:PS-10 peptidase S37